jgi:hypothetical protein
MNNLETFIKTLEVAYTDLFANNPEYAFAASRGTPAQLAAKMGTCLLTGEANKDGEGIKRACKALGIKHTYAAIRAYLSS